MKNIITILIAISLIGSVIPVSFAEETVSEIHEIHISPDGNNENDGSAENPVKTFERARDIYRELKAADESFEGEILVHGGIYRLTKSFTLNSQDSGMKISAYGDGEVSVRGSVKLSKGLFKKTTDEEFLSKVPENAQDKIYEIDLSAYLTAVEKHPEYRGLSGGTAYYELYVGEELQTIARWPNYGYAITGNSSGLTFETDSERVEKWKNSKYGLARGYWYHDWAMEQTYIGDIDVDKSKVTLSKELEYSSGVKKGQRYYVSNMPEEMDIPGEYYIDCDTKKLYYYPTKAFSDNHPELSVLKNVLFSLDGASDIEISGLTFEYTRANAISAKNGSNVVIDGCIVRNIGNQAIGISCTNSAVKNCELYNLGGAGISVSGGTSVTLTPGNSEITNNNIYNFGRIFRTYQAGISVNGVGNKAMYNTIHDTPHCAIRFGGNDNIISHNEIYNVVYECSDSGAIYSGRNWTCWGNEISYNYFHDIKQDENLVNYYVAAVYLDDMLSGITVKNNLFKNCTLAFHIGGGKGNILTDNIMVDCKKGIEYDDRAVTGNWAHSSVISGGTVYEGLMTFLKSEDLDIEVWKEKYQGFKEMLEDVYAYQNDETHETGYPENATITGNINYGENVENENYEDISEYVYEYGTVSGNIYSEEIGEYSVPEYGADKFLWNDDFSVYFPGNGEIFDKGDVEFVWSRAGGADYYETVVTDEAGERVFYNKSLYNGCYVKIKEKGTYNWKINAVSKGETVSKEGVFTIRKNYYQPGTVFGGTDFEDTDIQGLKELGWSFDVAEGDSITLETDEMGNGYLKMVRNEDNLLSGSATYAKMKFPEKQTGKITVTYDIMLENYRAGWRDMGSVQTKSGGDVMRLLTHLSWVYGMATDSERYHLNLSERPGNSYMTVKRVIDLDNNTYKIDVYQDGARVNGAVDKVCGDGAAENLLFRLAYQSPFQPKDGEGDAVYRIDNVSVDMGEISPSYTSPLDDDYDVVIDSEIKVKWNSAVNPESINKDTVSVFENDVKLSDYIITADEKNILIGVTDGLKYDSIYRVVLSKNIEADSLTHTEMSEDYEFSFSTQKDESVDENDLQVIETVPGNDATEENIEKIDIIFNYDIDAETVNDSNIKVYKYSYPISEYKLSVSENVVTINFANPVEKGAECSVIVKTGILPEGKVQIKSMKSDYCFKFTVKNESTEKNVIDYDFENWNDFSLTGPVLKSHNGWTFELYEGDSVSVESDSITGNKGLKIIKGSENSMMKVYMDYVVSGDELIKVNFDTRFENHSRRIHDWGSVTNSDYTTFLKMVVWKDGGYWHRQIGDTKRYLCILGDTVTKVEQILNSHRSEYIVNIYKNGSLYTQKSESANSKVLPERLYFAVNNQQDNYLGTAEGDGVYWIDNVSVKEIYTPKVENISSDYMKSAEITFNRNINSETVTKSNIKVYDNGILAEYSLVACGEKSVIINFAEKMKAGHTYSFEIDGILSENGTEMLEEYTADIECAEIFKIEEIADSENGKVISVITNAEDYICIAAVKDLQGRLIKSKILYDEGNGKIISDYTDENVTYYFWESIEKMRPLIEKYPD